MAHKNSIAAEKKVYTIFRDEETRGFFASLKGLKKDCEDAEAAKQFEAAEAALKCAEDAQKAAKKRAADLQREAAKKPEKAEAAAEAAAEAKKAAEATEAAKKAAQKAQQKAAEAQKRCADARTKKALQSLSEVMLRKGLKAEDITKDFLLSWLPLRFNSLQQVCAVSLIPFEEEAAAREKYTDFPAALQSREDRLFLYKPINLFTANTFFSLFCSAADARRKAEKEVLSAAEKEAKKREAAEKEAKRIEAMRAKVAAYDAKQQKAAENK